MRPTLLLLAACTLGGCKLVDQTTFAPATQTPAPARVAALARVGNRAALLTIRYASPAPDYAEALRTAVDAAERRRPGTEYDVVAVVPTAQDPTLVTRELGLAEQNAANVMRAMIGLGVPDTRIGLGARTEPGLPVREVRVYLR